MAQQLSNYLGLLIPEHQNEPNFEAFLSIFLQGQVDNQNVLAQFPQLFDVDVATGWWLDQVGVRVGQSRYVSIPYDVYFSWDITGLGWDQGTWQGNYDPDSQLATLPDDSYRQLLKAVIAANHWDGTVPGAYAVWAIAFGPGPNNAPSPLQIVDNQNMTMTVIWIGPAPGTPGGLTAVQIGLLKSGKLSLKPAGVGITGYYWKDSGGNLNPF